MGARNSYETLARIFQAFAEKRSWRQADLARKVGVEPKRIRTVMTDLAEADFPFHGNVDKNDASWSVPPGWLAGGLLFEAEDWAVLVHAVLHVADPARRKRLLRRLLSLQSPTTPLDSDVERLDQAIAPTTLGAEEHQKSITIEQAIIHKRALRLTYLSTHRRDISSRTITPERLEPHGRLVAFCHTNRELRWFRLDSMISVEMETEQAPRPSSPDEVARFLSMSVDGYRDGSDELHAFWVRSPESVWVKNNLLKGMSVEPEASSAGIRVVARGGALVVARFIAGLGGAAVAEGDKLRAMVRQVAAGTLKANGSENEP